jgi:hypothetical protein
MVPALTSLPPPSAIVSLRLPSAVLQVPFWHVSSQQTRGKGRERRPRQVLEGPFWHGSSQGDRQLKGAGGRVGAGSPWTATQKGLGTNSGSRARSPRSPLRRSPRGPGSRPAGWGCLPEASRHKKCLPLAGTRTVHDPNIPCDQTRERKDAQRAAGIYKSASRGRTVLPVFRPFVFTAAMRRDPLSRGGSFHSSASRSGGHVAGRRAARIAAQYRIGYRAQTPEPCL